MSAAPEFDQDTTRLSYQAYAATLRDRFDKTSLGLLSENPEIASLIDRAIHYNARKKSDRETLSTSSVFAAACLWGREETNAPAPLRQLKKLTDPVWEAFELVFLERMLADGEKGLSAPVETVTLSAMAETEADKATPELRLSASFAEVLPALSGTTEVSLGDLLRKILTTGTSMPANMLAGRLKEVGLELDVLVRVLGTDSDDGSTGANGDGGTEAGAQNPPPGGGEDAVPTSAAPLAEDRARRRHDSLGRGPLAFAIAHRLWRVSQMQCEGDRRDAGAFVIHLDAPWGGGKTTFANFVAAVLETAPWLGRDQKEEAKSLAADLRTPIGIGNWPGTPKDKQKPLPWTVVRFNAWRSQHVSPPWWNFYEEFREECLARMDWWDRLRQRLDEWFWRVLNPETSRWLIALAAFLGLLGIVTSPSLFDSLLPALAAKPDLVSGVAAGDIVTYILLALAGGSGIKMLVSARNGVQSVIDAAGKGAQPEDVGEGDPLRRFRDRFARVVRRLNRPVLVIIDDLDRCEPAYVVEMMRGTITVFGAPEVVYLVLGDRRWIETCFAKVYEDMNDARDTAGGVSFGARFAEKAMQLSFLLPEPSDERRKAYFSEVLGLASGTETARQSLRAKMAEDADLKKSLERIAKAETEQQRNREAKAAIKQVTGGAPTPETEAMEREIDEVVAVAAAASERTTEEITHHLQALDEALLPRNPRQIKRLVNMIAIYQASARAVLGYEHGGRDWRHMVLWILLMVRQPEAWRTLCERPELADPQPAKADSAQALLAEEPAASILAGGFEDAFSDVKFDSGRVKELRRLTPIR